MDDTSISRRRRIGGTVVAIVAFVTAGVVGAPPAAHADLWWT